MLDALLCLTDPGDEVILTDPTYAGMLNRVRLAGAVPRLVALHSDTGEWRLDLDALRAAVSRPHARGVPQQRLVSHRLGGERRGVGGGGRPLRRARPLAALLGGLRGRALRRPRSAPSRRAAGHARAHRDRGRAIVGAAHDRLAHRLGGDARRADRSGVARADLQRAGGERLRPGRHARGAGGGRRGRGRGHRRVAAPARRDPAPARGPAGGAAARRLGRAARLRAARPRRRPSSRPGCSSTSVAATPMDGWGGEVAASRLRFVFSNEPVERLALLGERVRAALA